MTNDGLAPTGARILDATLAVVGRVGLAAMALEEVADVAGVSRQTIYRHFGSRDGLLGAVIVREEEQILATLDAAASGADDLRDAIAAGLAAALEGAAEHPLLRRLLRDEPENLLPFLALPRGPVLGVLGPAVAGIVRRFEPGLAEADLDFVADVVGRVTLSWVISPPDEAVVDVAHRLAGLVVDGVPTRVGGA